MHYDLLLVACEKSPAVMTRHYKKGNKKKGRQQLVYVI